MYHLRNLIALALVLISFGASANTSELKDLEIKMADCEFDPAKDAGRYDWEHVGYDDIAVPEVECEKDEKITVSFFQINEEAISLQMVKDHLKERSCRPLTWLELFNLGAQHPEAQRDRHIAAAGSIWTYKPKHPHLKGQTFTFASYLDSDDIDGRNLGFDNVLSGWGRKTYFAAVCDNE